MDSCGNREDKTGVVTPTAQFIAVQVCAQSEKKLNELWKTTARLKSPSRLSRIAG
jgi:hypothetical protein